MVVQKQNNNLKIFLIIALFLIIAFYIYKYSKKEHLKKMPSGGGGSISSCISCCICIGVMMTMMK
jgi:hypothetical protein